MKTFLNQIHRIVRDEDGVAIVQYALLLALIAVTTTSAALRLLPDFQSTLNWLFEIFCTSASQVIIKP